MGYLSKAVSFAKKADPTQVQLNLAQKVTKASFMPKAVQKLSPVLGNVKEAYIAGQTDIIKNQLKQYGSGALLQLSGGFEMPPEFEVAQQYSNEFYNNPPAVESQYQTQEYVTTPSGLQPKVKGAQETSIATSTLVLGGIAVLFMASLLKK